MTTTVYCTSLGSDVPSGTLCVDCGQPAEFLGRYHDWADTRACDDNDSEREPICAECADERRDRLG